MKVLFLCNLMPAFVGSAIGINCKNKEGWIEGMARSIIDRGEMQLALCFPTPDGKSIKGDAGEYKYYGFVEDGDHPEAYDEKVEKQLLDICDDYRPDVIHCFGTEFPHTLALLKLTKYKGRALIHLQGLMKPYGDSYMTGLPDKVVNNVTFRDWLRHDSIRQQQQKYLKRAEYEKKILENAVNVCGRTEFDKNYLKSVNPSAKYYKLNETLRHTFFDSSTSWDISKCEKHRIFVSQGNYPLKGLHFALRGVGQLVSKYPDITMYVAGDNVTRHSSLKDKIKISAYGKYLLQLIKENGLEGKVFFTGSLKEDEMKAQYLKCQVFLMPSVLENSPNSLGEAMVLGTPVVTANVGGIASMADRDEVMFYELQDVDSLAKSIEELFENEEMSIKMGQKAKAHGLINHSPDGNYEEMKKVYEDIAR